MALLAVTPIVLMGCSGGGSSNSSASATRANLAYGTSESPNILEPINLQNVFKPKTYLNGVPNFEEGDGVYSCSTTVNGLPTRYLSNIIITNTIEEYRALSISRTTSADNYGSVGTVYDLADPSAGRIRVFFQRRYHSDFPPYGSAYESWYGTVTVIAIKGNFVTLELKNVRLNNITDGSNDPTPIFVNGNITYNRSNIERFNMESGGSSDSFAAFLKKSSKN